MLLKRITHISHCNDLWPRIAHSVISIVAFSVLGSNHLIFMGGGGGGRKIIVVLEFFSTETESSLFLLSAVSSWIFFFS